MTKWAFRRPHSMLMTESRMKRRNSNHLPCALSTDDIAYSYYLVKACWKQFIYSYHKAFIKKCFWNNSIEISLAIIQKFQKKGMCVYMTTHGMLFCIRQDYYNLNSTLKFLFENLYYLQGPRLSDIKKIFMPCVKLLQHRIRSMSMDYRIRPEFK